MGNASEELGKVVNPNKLGMRQLEMDPTAWGRSDLGRGMEGLMSGAAAGIDNAVSQIGDTLNRSDLNVGNWGPKKEEQKAQTASANYTGQASTQRSGSGKSGSGKLTSTDKKSGKGKRALTIQK